MKKGAWASVGSKKEKEGKEKQRKEKEKKKKIDKMNQMKKEAWKTIDMLVTEGEKPFWYGFK